MVVERLARPSTNGCVQVTTKVFIATARPIGEECIDYAKNNMLDGFELCDNLEEANVVICVMYDKILSEDFIKNKRCYNFHGGLLPDYRGVGIFSWVIINGEKETGITLHELDAGLDTGPIISCKKFLVTEASTAHSLYTQGMNAMLQLFKEYFHKLLIEDYQATPVQKKPNSLYTRKMLSDLQDITRLVRAFHFPEKEGLYYKNSEGTKTIIEYD